MIVPYTHLHLSAGAEESDCEREDKTAQFITGEFHGFVLGFLRVFVFILRVGREEGKQMCSELGLADDNPFIYYNI